MQDPYIIIGASAAGIAAAQKLRQLDPVNTIICISDENEMPYNKCMLADYVSGIKQEDEVYTLTAQAAAQKNITLLLGKKVVAADAQQKTVVLNDGQTLNYHKLLLAVGTSPTVPPIKGLQDNPAGVFTFHRMRDMQAILNFIASNQVQKAVVIGAGLSGLECADALNALGVRVDVVELQNGPLSSFLDDAGSQFLQNAMSNQQVNFIGGCQVTEIRSKSGLVDQVVLNDGRALPAQLVVIAVGLRPNMELPNQIGLKTTPQGVLVDDYMQTSMPNIYAAGDICMVKDQLLGALVPNRTWPDAMFQGLIAATSMAGQTRVYPGLSTVISSAFFGLKFAVCGPIAGQGQVIIAQEQGFYHRFLVDQGQIKGFLLVGNTSKLGHLRQAVMTKSQVSPELLGINISI